MAIWPSTDGRILHVILHGGNFTEEEVIRTYRSADYGSTWTLVSRGAMISMSAVSADGLIRYEARTNGQGGSQRVDRFFSSAFRYFPGLSGIGELKLIYLGAGAFGVNK